MQPLAFIQSMSGGRGEKTTFKPETTISRRVSTNRKSHGRTYKQAGKDSEAAITNNQEIPQKASKKDKPSVNILGKKKTLATDIKMYLNDKLLSPIKEDSGKVEQERGRRSVTPDYMTPFKRHSFSVCPNQSYRTVSGDVTCEQKCTTCAVTVLQAQNTTQTEVGKPVVAQEAAIEKKDDCEAKTGCVPVPTRQEMTLPKSVRKKFFQSALTRPSFVPTPPPPAQKQNHIWSTRVNEIVWKKRVVSGFLKREKVPRNLIRESSEFSGQSVTPSPVKDARFLSLQSLLVPVTNNTGVVNGKSEQ